MHLASGKPHSLIVWPPPPPRARTYPPSSPFPSLLLSPGAMHGWSSAASPPGPYQPPEQQLSEPAVHGGVSVGEWVGWEGG